MSSEQRSNEIPNSSDNREQTRLEQWSIIVLDPFLPPENQKSYLNGIVYGHPNHQDGHRVTTSRLLEIDPEYKWAVTKSRTYLLGEMSQEFKEYLDAKV